VFVTGDSIVYSASDLAAAARCEYALLRDFDAKLGRGPAVSIDDELLARTAALGTEHERRRLDRYRDEFGDAVAVIGRPAYTLAGLTAAADATRRAIAKRAPVVYQAAMFDGRFVVRRLPRARRRAPTVSPTPSWRARPRSPRCCSWRPTPMRWPARVSRWRRRPN
jgi:hypothetical protein